MDASAQTMATRYTFNFPYSNFTSFSNLSMQEGTLDTAKSIYSNYVGGKLAINESSNIFILDKSR